MLSGVNPAQSKLNLITWLDAVIYRCSATSLVLDINRNREHTLFHHIKRPDYDKVAEILSGLNAWGGNLHHSKYIVWKVLCSTTWSG